jgi:hypothetical protein
VRSYSLTILEHSPEFDFWPFGTEAVKSNLTGWLRISQEAKCRYSCPILTKTGTCWQISLKLRNVKFHENPFNSFRVVSYMQTVGWTERTKLTGAFLQLSTANVPISYNLPVMLRGKPHNAARPEVEIQAAHFSTTKSLEQSPSREANLLSDNILPPRLWNPKVHYRVHNSRSPVPVLTQVNRGLMFSVTFATQRTYTFSCC